MKNKLNNIINSQFRPSAGWSRCPQHRVGSEAQEGYKDGNVLK